ncbi:RHS repeat domain-containing protein [Pseudoxanthomonas mexicana]
MRQGLIACRQYHTLSGRIAEICAGNAACNLMKEAYVWDAAGNLASHQKEGRYLEGFTYDSLNRVTEGRLTMANGVTVNQVMLSNAYDALGNVCSRNGVGYGYPGADGCVGAVPMAQAASIPSLASAVLPRYQRMARPVTQRPQGAALNRGQLQAPEGRYRRYSEDRPSWDDEADAWSLGFENGTGPAGWQRRPSRTGGRPSASAALPTATRQLATLTATAVTQAAVSSVASSPHAVNQVGSGTSATFYYYDDRGNQTVRDAPGTGSDRTIRYTADGKAHEIQLGSGQTTRFWYGPDGQRYKRTDGTTTTYYVGGVEVVVQNGVQTARRYVAGVALQTVVDGAVQATRYLFHDHLGSLVRIANVDGSVAESLDYTALGDRRAYGNPSGAGAASTLTPRGFTGHEYVDGMQVIHMNGRIYDPQLGRFLQPDPVIQDPTNAQSWNAYTYVFNNPLAYTDPSGMMSERAWNNVWRVKELEGPSLLSKWVAAVSSSFGAAVQFIWRRCPTGWVSVHPASFRPIFRLSCGQGARSTWDQVSLLAPRTCIDREQGLSQRSCRHFDGLVPAWRIGGQASACDQP